VIHRDIKPANLLLDAKGALWVTDFGLAHVNDVNLTRTGDFVGTLRYVSPEQASGSRVLADHRADVYSLGATLYELLTLEPIFAGPDRRALLHQILEEEPRPPRQVDRSIPVELGDDRPEGGGEGPRRPLRQRGRTGRRPPPLPGRRAHPRPPAVAGGEGDEVGEAAQIGGDLGRGGRCC